jgi:mono/diheme cytochrome c family protein
MRNLMRKQLTTLLATAALLGCAVLPAQRPTLEVTWLDQGLSQADRDRLYHLSQGTRLLPRSWLLALEQPRLSLTGAERFAAPEHLARYGFIPSSVSTANPDGLPVGFAVGTVGPADGAARHEVVVGLSCAACHTGQIEYGGRAIRIDGGSAMIDLATFRSQMGQALLLTAESDIRFARFAGRVLALEEIADTEEARLALRERLRAAVERGRAESAQAARLKLHPVAEGFGRLDAFARGGNFLFGTTLNEPRNLSVADGPVSFPALWYATWFDWVQYNGSIRQPLARSVTEALGVGSIVNLTGAENERYTSSVQVHNVVEMERLVAGDRPGAGLRPPAWPEAILGPIDRDAAARGAAHYARLCADCHAPQHVTGPTGRPEIAVRMLPLARIGTDPNTAANFTNRRAFLVPGSTQSVTAAEGLQHLTERVIQTWFARNAVPEETRRQMVGERPNEWRAPLAYRAAPLNGIWATAPFLHNGSVPSLYQLLLPAPERDMVFFTGSRQFDPRAVGFETAEFPGGFRFDATLPGNRNTGHSFGGPPETPGLIGPRLSEEQRWELIEYLKTL